MAVNRSDDEQAAVWLPATSYVVMGLLSFGQRLTGYEIRQWALGSTRFFWSAPAMSQIYRELERLSSAGFVDDHDDAEPGGRPRTTYGLTDDGLAALRHWVEDAPYEEPIIRHPAAFRLFLGHIADRAKLIELLEAHQQSVSAVLSDLKGVRDGLVSDQRFELPLAVAEWGLDLFGADRRGAGAAKRTVIDGLDGDDAVR